MSTTSLNQWTPAKCGSTCGAIPVKAVAACESRILDNISMILVSMVGFTNDPAVGGNAFETELTTRLSNTSTTSNAIRFLKVNASLPDATPNMLSDERDRQFVKDTQRSIEWTDSDMSDENYAFQSSLQCMVGAKFWYIIDGYLFGGKNGIDGTYYSIFSSTRNDNSVPTKFSCKVSFVERGIIHRAEYPL